VDQSGAVIPKATVTLTAPSGVVRTTTAAENGLYSFGGLRRGQYTVRAAAPKLEQEPVSIVLKPGTQTLRLELKVAALQQQTAVQEHTNTSVSTESANNASALVLTGEDLASLADDPEDLGADLQALAGPSAGPAGTSIFIDGFTGGQLPSKSAIREIKINQNPFSPEYDKLGFGRIEILYQDQGRTNSTAQPITTSAMTFGIPGILMLQKRLRFC
jgi:Carboxypeptidase regulatory-like domain